MYYIQIGTPGLSHVLAIKLPVAWEEMGNALGTIERKVNSETGEEPLIVGMDLYPLSAELSFYLPDLDTQKRVSGRHLFGRKSLMWNHWYPVSTAHNKTIIIVDHHKNSLSDDKLTKYFKRLGPVGHEDITKNGRPAGRFYYRIGYGYQYSI